MLKVEQTKKSISKYPPAPPPHGKWLAISLDILSPQNNLQRDLEEDTLKKRGEG